VRKTCGAEYSGQRHDVSSEGHADGAFATDFTASKKCGRGQMLASAKISTAILAGGLFFQLAACGYSQEEWDQKVRENSALMQQVAAQEKANSKCAADHATANQELDGLKRKFQERGVSS
jgi:hypothetical protein